jgi:hypothetical protein
MWVFTKYGFLSIVEHKEEDMKDHFLVRARVRTPLDELWPNHKLLKLDEADYRYRIIIPKIEAIDVLTDVTGSIDYPNFKNACKEDAAYHEVLTKLWYQLARYQFLVERNGENNS